MPSKNVVRNFSEESYYHVFNRGVEKRKIFMDEQDYKIFVYYLFVYLSPLERVLISYPRLPIRLQGRNLHGDIKLISYCLMPNHFHFLLKQKNIDGVSKFLKQLTNAYTLYFNKKYKRVGGLMQGRFKAIGIIKDELLIHVARYIHLNPVVAGLVNNPKEYNWSSHKLYFTNNDTFVTRKIILSYFPSIPEYEKFVLDQINYAKVMDRVKDVLLED